MSMNDGGFALELAFMLFFGMILIAALIVVGGLIAHFTRPKKPVDKNADLASNPEEESKHQ